MGRRREPRAGHRLPGERHVPFVDSGLDPRRPRPGHGSRARAASVVTCEQGRSHRRGGVARRRSGHEGGGRHAQSRGVAARHLTSIPSWATGGRAPPGWWRDTCLPSALEVRTGVAHTGVVGVLRGGKPGRWWRCAPTWMPCRSPRKWTCRSSPRRQASGMGSEVGVMHACGHDNHVAILMGAAEVLAGMKADLPGTVEFLFQPAEEGAPPGEEGGAAVMIGGRARESEVDRPSSACTSVRDPVGVAELPRPDRSWRRPTALNITVKGRQTHGAQPWARVDPDRRRVADRPRAADDREPPDRRHRVPAIVTVGPDPGRRTRQHHSRQRRAWREPSAPSTKT